MVRNAPSRIKWGDEKTYRSFLIAIIAAFDLDEASITTVHQHMQTMNYDITARSVQHKLADVKNLARKLKNGEDIGSDPILNGNTSGKPRKGDGDGGDGGDGATAPKKRKAKEPAVAANEGEESEEEPRPAKKTKKAAAVAESAEPAAPAAKPRNAAAKAKLQAAMKKGKK